MINSRALPIVDTREPSLLSDIRTKVQLLASQGALGLLGTGLRGIERETLRVQRSGLLARSSHPRALGSALMHPAITTDFSESLLEFITAPEPSNLAAYKELDEIHRYASSRLNGDILWSQSMPCVLPEETSIPIADYGNSHLAQLKQIYRKGLASRYGSKMQCIAGVHYSYSLNVRMWPVLRDIEGSAESIQEFRSMRYIATMRNFQRHGWLLSYLFGASPACCASFASNDESALQRLSSDTLYLPFATSLRMSDLGYKNTSRPALSIPVNSLDDYMQMLAGALVKPSAEFAKLGVYQDGKWIQLNDKLLQLENEHYASIRPKAVPRQGERILQALERNGVEYLEVRALDIDPLDPNGISVSTMCFIETFLLYCLLSTSPPTSSEEYAQNSRNMQLVAKEGRRPGLQLEGPTGPAVMKDWGQGILDQMIPLAKALDSALGTRQYMQALKCQREKMHHVEETPSAKVLKGIIDGGSSFPLYTLANSWGHALLMSRNPVSKAKSRHFDDLGLNSVHLQHELEKSQQGSFASYLARFQCTTIPTPLQGE